MSPARAATIKLVLKPYLPPLLLVEGELEHGDEKEFRQKALAAPEAIVLLSSAGGNARAGMEIGRAIRLMGFPTVILEETRCASACALAWLGGQPRFMAQTAKVGFHAVFTMDGERRKETAPGNALVGAYVNSLGLPMKAVLYITQSPPDSMSWLTFEDAAGYGIEVRPFPPEPSRQAEKQPPIVPAPEPAPKAEPRRDPPTVPGSTGSTAPFAPKPDLPSPVPPAPVKRELSDLLDVQEAAAVQERLRGLGYFFGVKDGVWGPRSRIALRDFKRQNRLALTDVWDLDTQAALNRDGAMPAPASYIPPEPEFTSEGIFWPFLPVPGTTYHPLNPDDAELLQEQLLVGGYYQSSPEGIWGMDSRNALRRFKAANGLPTDDIWDVATERALMGRR